MNIYSSRLWKEDLDSVIGAYPLLAELAGKSVLVTGCTGLICSAITDLLIRWNETKDEKIGIYAAGRSLEKIKSRFSAAVGTSWFRTVPYDATSRDLSFDFTVNYVIHGAGNATPRHIMQEPVETMTGNFLGLRNLMDYAREKGTKRVLYISSSEIYGQKEEATPYREGEYGYVDILNPRNSYSVGKRAAETLCAAYYSEYGTDSVIVRPGHVYGPTATRNDDRVSSAWSYDAAEGRDLVMKSDGRQLRSYCHALDSASAILTVLLRGKVVHAYNISNPDAIITIAEMAEELAKAGNVRLIRENATEIEQKSYNPMSCSALESRALEGLGWKGVFPAEKGFSHTVQCLQEMILGEKS